MTNRPLVIDDINLDDVKYLLYSGQRMSITTATFEKIIERLEELTQECRILKGQFYSEMISVPKIRMIRYMRTLDGIERYCCTRMHYNSDLKEAYTPILEVIRKAKGEE